MGDSTVKGMMKDSAAILKIIYMTEIMPKSQ
jgi:hypothetical protein